MSTTIETEQFETFSIRLPISLKRTLEELAAQERRSLGGQITVLLESALKNSTVQGA